jgi:hypothetical protein
MFKVDELWKLNQFILEATAILFCCNFSFLDLFSIGIFLLISIITDGQNHEMCTFFYHLYDFMKTGDLLQWK